MHISKETNNLQHDYFENGTIKMGSFKISVDHDIIGKHDPPKHATTEMHFGCTITKFWVKTRASLSYRLGFCLGVRSSNVLMNLLGTDVII